VSLPGDNAGSKYPHPVNATLSVNDVFSTMNSRKNEQPLEVDLPIFRGVSLNSRGRVCGSQLSSNAIMSVQSMSKASTAILP